MFFRVLAVIWRDGQSVHVETVRAGMAELYRGARCQVDCRELQGVEIEARQRLWSQSLPQHTAPSRRRPLGNPSAM